MERRAADDLENVAGRSLVFERFFEIARALAQFVEEPRVFHRSDRLRREALQQRDLLVGKRANLLSIDGQCAEQNIVLAQRNGEQAAATADFNKSSSSFVA
jgi:maltooligosyltrehalose synthase